MPTFLQPYAKAVVGCAFITLVLLLKRWGVSYPDLDSFLFSTGTDLILAALGTWAIYQVPNKGQ